MPRTLIARTSLFLTLCAIGLLAWGPMASTGVAGGDPSVCPKQTLCVWGDSFYSAQLVKMKNVGVTNKLGKKMDDQASSVFNRRGRVSYLYADADGQGESYCIEPHQKITFLTFYNDVASSARLTKHRKQCPV
jgi:hypothetical protein